MGPGSCGRSLRPHRGNHRAAAAPPCRPRDCLSSPLGVGILWPPFPEIAPPTSVRYIPSSPRRRRRRHARGRRQIPQKVTTSQCSVLPSRPGALKIFLEVLGFGLEASLGKAGSSEEEWEMGRSHGKGREKVHSGKDERALRVCKVLQPLP